MGAGEQLLKQATVGLESRGRGLGCRWRLDWEKKTGTRQVVPFHGGL